MIKYKNDFEQISYDFNGFDTDALEVSKKSSLFGDEYELRYGDLLLFTGAKSGVDELVTKFQLATSGGFANKGLTYIWADPMKHCTK